MVPDYGTTVLIAKMLTNSLEHSMYIISFMGHSQLTSEATGAEIESPRSVPSTRRPQTENIHKINAVIQPQVNGLEEVRSSLRGHWKLFEAIGNYDNL